MSIHSLVYDTPGKFQETRFEKIHNLTFGSSSEASKLVAVEIANGIRSCHDRPYVLGLATGSSPIGVYQELVRLHREEGLSFKNVVTFNLDEYYPIDPSDMRSYHHFMHTHLFDHIDIPADQINIPKGDGPLEEVRAYCTAYEERINAYGGLDFQLLGIGRTAHIGFNEPGSHQNSVTRLITLDAITREDAAHDFNGLEHVPKKAITMGVASIMKAKRVVLLAWGHKKAQTVARTIEGEVSSKAPASFLQHHKNATIVLDEEAASALKRIKTPWLVGSCEWTEDLRKKAIVWLCTKLGKSILMLTQRDYNEHGLSDLIATMGSAYELNIWMFNQIQKTITGWPGGKPGHSDENRPERSTPAVKRSIIFSPHPDDDVISMGGTFARLIDQGHEVHVAYQTSGNIAVSDEDALRYVEVALRLAPKSDTFLSIKQELLDPEKAPIDSEALRLVKGTIRRSECLGAGRFLKLPVERLHFLDLPFYETGTVRKNPPTQKDVDKTIALLEEIKPHQIFAAGDLADPHGTHRTCLDVLFEALKQVKDEPYMQDCWVWLYRGAWQEWEIHEIHMAVPMSPDQVLQKRNAIFFHQSQKDKVMFQGEDKREFWVRAEERNRDTAQIYNALGLAEYQAMEAFRRYEF